MSNYSPFPDMWECRAEGTLKDGQKAYSSVVVDNFMLKRTIDEVGYRKAAEGKVLWHYFNTYDAVPYRIYWVREGREWLEAVPSHDCCIRDVGEDNPSLEIYLRDTRDHTCDREDQ